jgi:hypothetical protein
VLSAPLSPLPRRHRPRTSPHLFAPSRPPPLTAPAEPTRQTRHDSSESAASSSVRLPLAILIVPHSQARTARGTAIRLGIVSANKIASCTFGNPRETSLTADGRNPARHTEETLCKTLKNSRDNPSFLRTTKARRVPASSLRRSRAGPQAKHVPRGQRGLGRGSITVSLITLTDAIPEPAPNEDDPLRIREPSLSVCSLLLTFELMNRPLTPAIPRAPRCVIGTRSASVPASSGLRQAARARGDGSAAQKPVTAGRPDAPWHSGAGRSCSSGGACP